VVGCQWVHKQSKKFQKMRRKIYKHITDFLVSCFQKSGHTSLRFVVHNNTACSSSGYLTFKPPDIHRSSDAVCGRNGVSVITTGKRILQQANKCMNLVTMTPSKQGRLAYSLSHHEETREKEIMEGTMTGARRRGRPRTAWMDNIKTQDMDRTPCVRMMGGQR